MKKIFQVLMLIMAMLISTAMLTAQEIQPIQRGLLAARPATPAFGRLYMVTNSGAERLTYFNGTTWVDVYVNATYLTGSGLTPVTLAGQNYLSLSGQQITANAVNLATGNVTGILPVLNGGTGAASLVNLLSCADLSNEAPSCATDATTTANITDSLNKRFVTDANLVVINNTSGVNTGDQTLAGLGGVPLTRNINTTSPLGGGGDLSADRTLTCTTCGVTGSPLSQFAATSSAQLAGVISDETGTGLATFATNPVFPSYVDFGEIADPAAPGAAVSRLYGFDFHGTAQLKFVDSTSFEETLSRDSILTVKNVTGSTITKGNLVYFTGVSGNVPTIAKARSNSLTTMPAIGVTAESITNNGFGRILAIGVVSNVNTSAFSEADDLWVSTSTAGAFQNTIPIFPDIAQRAGTVVTSGVGNGSITILVSTHIATPNLHATSHESGGTDPVTVANLTATNSAGIAGIVSDETGTGVLVFNNGPTLVAPVLGTPASGTMTNVTGTAAGLTAGTVTTNANLTGPITSVGNATSIASQTGTGTTFVIQDTPTLTTPVLGVATATTINKVAITAPATSATLTIADGVTLSAPANATVSGTNTGDQDVFAHISDGTDTIDAVGDDTVTLVAGTNITITADPMTNEVTFDAAGGSGTPGAPDTSVQFNDGGSFAGDADLTFVTDTLTATKIVTTSIDKVAITAPATSATLTIADGKTLTASNDADVSGTNTGDQTSVSGNAGTVTTVDAGADTTTWVLVGNAQTGDQSPASDAGLTFNANTNALTTTTFIGALTGNASTVTTNANLTGVITSVGNATSIGAQTGTGSTFVVDTSPVLVTPDLGTPSAAVLTNATGTAAGLTAGAATVLATARTIGGTSFNGSANIVPATITVADTTDATSSIAIFESATGDLAPKTDGGLTYDASNGTLTATTFSGPLTGNVTGNVSGTSGSTTGNAATATALQTGRTIGGVSFDGTANIVPGTITVADTTDTTSSVALFESATGDLAPKTDGAITYNAGTGALTATSFVGALTGNADTVTVADAGGDTSTWVLLGTSQTGSLAPASDAGLTYQATTNALTATTFIGALTGNADTVTSGVYTSRSISTTSPITGGGDLSADRTFACATCGVTGTGLSQFASTTSAQLATVLSNETGSGLATFATAPALLLPTISDSSDTSKTVAFSLSGMTTAKTLTLSSAQTTTQTLTVPNITTAETLAVRPQTSSATNNTCNTTATGGDMCGDSISITPTITGKLFIIISGQAENNTGDDGFKYDIRYGTGGAPSDGGALAGTVCGSQVTGSAVANASNTAIPIMPFSHQCIVSGLTVGTAYWIELGIYAVTGGTATFSAVNASAFEL